MSWAWWDWPLTSLTNHHPSVPWRYWLGHLTRKIVSEMTYNVSSGTLNTTILHSLICRVLLLLLLLLLLRNASDLRNCTSYFGACMWVSYCRPPIGAHFHPTPQPPPVPQQLGEKDGSPLRGVARLCRGRRPPLGDRTRLVFVKILRLDPVSKNAPNQKRNYK